MLNIRDIFSIFFSLSIDRAEKMLEMLKMHANVEKIWEKVKGNKVLVNFTAWWLKFNTFKFREGSAVIFITKLNNSAVMFFTAHGAVKFITVFSGVIKITAFSFFIVGKTEKSWFWKVHNVSHNAVKITSCCSYIEKNWKKGLFWKVGSVSHHDVNQQLSLSWSI